MEFLDICVELFSKVTKTDLRNKLRSLISSTVSNKYNIFNLPLPASISRNTLNLYFTNSSNRKYYVCEKTDGIRALLLICSHGSFIVSRKFDFYYLQNDNNFLFTEVCKEKTCLFDSEIIISDSKLNNKTSIIIYLFDCIFLFDEQQFNKLTKERLNCIMIFIKEYRSSIYNSKDKSIFQSENYSISIFGKSLYPKKDIDKIFKNLTFPHNKHEIIHKEIRSGNITLQNKTDGFIFIAEDANYFCKNDGDLLKWKWEGMNTIDLLIIPPYFDVNGKTILYCGCSLENDSQFNTSNIIEVDRAEIPNLKSIISGNNYNKPLIIELSFNIRNGKYYIIKIRDDKDKPNFITTVVSTLSTIVENITYFELSKYCRNLVESSLTSNTTNIGVPNFVKLIIRHLPKINENEVIFFLGLHSFPKPIFHTTRADDRIAILEKIPFGEAEELYQKFDGHLLYNSELELSFQYESGKKIDYLFSNIFDPNIRNQIQVDEVGEYSVTESRLATSISETIKSLFGCDNIAITDATACCGGNTISFAKYFTYVNAIEIDAQRFAMLKHNVELLQLTNVKLMNCDYTYYYPDIKQNIIFIDPPWGGPDYFKEKSLELYLGEKKLDDFAFDLLKHFGSIHLTCLIFKLPLNYNFHSFTSKIKSKDMPDCFLFKCIYSNMAILYIFPKTSLKEPEKILQYLFTHITINSKGIISRQLLVAENNDFKWQILTGNRKGQYELSKIKKLK